MLLFKLIRDLYPQLFQLTYDNPKPYLSFFVFVFVTCCKLDTIFISNANCMFIFWVGWNPLVAKHHYIIFLRLFMDHKLLFSNCGAVGNITGSVTGTHRYVEPGISNPMHYTSASYNNPGLTKMKPDRNMEASFVTILQLITLQLNLLLILNIRNTEIPGFIISCS